MKLRAFFSTILTGVAVLGLSLPASSAPYIIGYDETKSLVADRTMMTYDRGHGTQVEYIAGNGKTYLLYPGNQGIVRGSWKLTKTSNPQVFDLCFRYPANSYNPSTGQSGGNWECQPAGFYLREIVDHSAGDVLGLARSKQVPFVLAKKKTKLKTLVRLLPK
jgi:hypothetical protein